MRSFLPEYSVSKVLLNSAHDAMPYYQYFKRENITSLIDLNRKGGRPPFTKTTLRLIKMVFLSVLPDFVCVEMVLKLLKAE